MAIKITTFREDGCIRGQFGTELVLFAINSDFPASIAQGNRAWEIPYNGRIEIEIEVIDETI